MRKFLLSTIALLMTISVMAIGLGDGSTKANAIDFDWANGHKPALSVGSWYRVNLSPLKAEANDPTLALYLTNLSNATTSVSLKFEASLLGQTINQSSNYNIAAKDYQLWSKQSFDYNGRKMSLKQLMSAGLSEVYLQLTSNGEIALSAKVYETEDIVDDACSKAKDFNWAGVAVPVGEQWYRLNLSDVKTNGKKLNFVVKNNGASVANVAFDMSLDCPASAVIEKDWTIAAGAEKEDEFGRIFLDVLNEDYVFVKLTTNQPLTLSVEEEVVVVDPSEFADFNCASATELVFDQVMNLTAGKHVYKVKRADLIAERDFDTEFNVTNLTGETANLAVEVAFACPVKSVVTQNLVLNANESIMKLVKGDVLKAVNSEWVYIRFITDKDLTATVGVRNVSPCVNALPFDWNTGAKLDAGESQWYEMDITTLKQNKKHLGLNFTNHADAIALVNVEVALDCEGTILPITLPVPNGVSLSQVIDYQILKRSPLNRIYVGVTTDSDIELAAWTKDAIAADQTPCLNALNPKHGVEYLHEANTTKWYKVSLDLLESSSNYSSIYLANKGNKRANITIGMVTDCQYTTSTTITLPLPAGFDFGVLAPNVLGRLLKQVARFEGEAYNKVDAKEVYLEIHSDQPVAFGLDVVNASTSPCLRDDLISFDWDNGAKVDAGDAKWFDMNLEGVKAAGKHVKLTFTNHTNELVWAATIVSVECPAKLTMPLIVPVPAGMSVDHVINYQLLAVADLPNIYLGVLTNGALELKAEGIDATITPSADCLAAKKIVSGVQYVQNPGSQWYQFPMSLIDEMGSAAKLSFENRTDNNANITAGVSVGCEYSPITLVKEVMPRTIDFSLNMPRSIIAKLRGLIDPNITDFYLQLTTDQTIALTLTTQSVNVNACDTAINFDWNVWETTGIKLEENKDYWYKVNFDDIFNKFKNGEDISVVVSNHNDRPVNLDLAVSTTCPVILSLEGSRSFPALSAYGVVFSAADFVTYLEKYDIRNILNVDYKALLKQVNVYTLYNKLDQILVESGYYDNVSAYVPMGRIETLVDKYGEAASLLNLKKLLEEPTKYIPVAEIKAQLASVKVKVQDKAAEKLTYDNMIAALEKYGDKIPYVDAEKIINNADLLLPYIGKANVVLNKCKQYITTDKLAKIVNRCKDYVPFEELKQVTARIEKRLKEYLPELEEALYINMIADGDLFIAPDTIPIPEGCEFAEEFVWNDVVEFNKDESKWYKFGIADLRGGDCKLTLTVNNTSDELVKADLELYEYCPASAENQIVTMSQMIEPQTIKIKNVTNAELPQDVDTIYLHVATDGAISVKLENSCIEYIFDTIPSYGCVDTIYNDTVHVTPILDSVYVHIVSQFVAPVEMTDSILAAINVAPVLTQGVVPNVDGTVDPIKAYYVSNDADSIADVVNVYWTEATLNTIVACGATSHTMDLVVVDECGNEFKTSHVFAVVAKDTTVIDTTILAGEAYVWDGIPYTTAGEYTEVFTDVNGCDSVVTLKLYVVTETTTIAYVCDGTEYVDPITSEKHIISSLIPSTWNWVDSIAIDYAINIHNFSIKPIVAPAEMSDSVLATIPSATPVLTPGIVPNVAGTIEAIKAYYVANDADSIADVNTVYWTDASLNTIVACGATTHAMTLVVEAGCDNIITTNLTFEVATIEDVVLTDTICYGGSVVGWPEVDATKVGFATYTRSAQNVNGCDSVTILNVVVLPGVVYEPAENATICFGGSYSWRGKDYTESASDTLRNQLGCDSIIYTLNLTVLPDVVYEPAENATICFGGSYQWRGQERTSNASDTLRNQLGCDSVIYTLNLTVLPDVVYEPAENATICFGGSYPWRGKDYTESASDTLRNQLGCDSVIYTLNLTVMPATTVVTTDTVICAGEAITWIDGVVYNATTLGKNYTAQYAGTTCDSIIGTLNLTVMPAATVVTTDTVICAGEAITWIDGVVYNATTLGKNYTAQYAGTTCDSIIGTLNLTVLPATTVVTTDTVICAGEAITWIDGVVYNVTTLGKNYTAQYAGTTCDSIIGTLNLTVMPAATVVTTDTVICAGEAITWIDGVVYNATTLGKNYTAQYVGTTCDSIIGTLNLTVMPAATVVTTDTVICAGEAITWIDGVVYNVTTLGKNYTAPYAGTTCDSIIGTLNLTVLPEAVTENETLIICESEFPYIWRGESLSAVGTHTVVEKYDGTDCDSVIHVLELKSYVMTLPLPTNIAAPIAVCGNPVDVTAATADIEAHIAATDLYAPNTVITWYVNGKVSNDPIKGGVNDVTVKYAITSDCGTIESAEFVVTVEAPTPENDVNMDDVLVVSKYENRIFLLHLNDFEAKFGWIPAPEEVTWYKVVGEVDVYGEDGDDVVVGTGHSYNEPDGSTIKAGEYYAVIKRTKVDTDDCQTTMRTLVLSSNAIALVPELVLNVVNPDENLRLINLNAEENTEVRVYNMMGELIDTYVVDQNSEFIFNAAHAAGYYLVEVRTANTKTTLRYIVK